MMYHMSDLKKIKKSPEWVRKTVLRNLRNINNNCLITSLRQMNVTKLGCINPTIFSLVLQASASRT